MGTNMIIATLRLDVPPMSHATTDNLIEKKISKASTFVWATVVKLRYRSHTANVTVV